MAICRLPHLAEYAGDTRDADSALALALAFNCLSPAGKQQTAGSFLSDFLPPILHRQVEFYFDRVARLAGMATWALLTPDKAHSLIESRSARPGAADWRSGDQLWLIDVHARYGLLKPILTDLRDRALAGHDAIHYCRDRDGIRRPRQLSRGAQGGFLRAPRRPDVDNPPGEIDLTCRADILHGVSDYFEGTADVMRHVLATRFCRRHMEMPIGRLHWLMNEIRMLRQSRLYFSDDGAPAGVLTWAWLSERTIARLAHVPLHDVHASEWNEGDHLCFVDVAASAGVRPAIERDVTAALFPEEPAALVYYPPRPDMPATVVHVDRQREPGKVRQWIGAACSTSASRSG